MSTPEPHDPHDHAQADARLADAIIARLKRHLSVLRSPMASGVEVTTAPGTISINLEQVEITTHINIHLGGET